MVDEPIEKLLVGMGADVVLREGVTGESKVNGQSVQVADPVATNVDMSTEVYDTLEMVFVFEGVPDVSTVCTESVVIATSQSMFALVD